MLQEHPLSLQPQIPVDHLLDLGDVDFGIIARVHTGRHRLQPQVHIDGCLDLCNGDNAIAVAIAGYSRITYNG